METLEFDNLIVVRTVSKIGLAGLRLGWRNAWQIEREGRAPTRRALQMDFAAEQARELRHSERDPAG